MKNNHVDACRELNRGSFKRAHLAACFTGIITLVVLVTAELADYLPDQMSPVRITLCVVMVYGLTFAMMMRTPGRALKRSRRLDEAEAVARTTSRV